MEMLKTTEEKLLATPVITAVSFATVLLGLEKTLTPVVEVDVVVSLDDEPTAAAVSPNTFPKIRISGVTVASDGFDNAAIEIPTVSAAVDVNFTVKVVAVVESDFAFVGAPAVPAVTVNVSARTSACDGTELSTPRPKEATATSAMRLKFVFVDICFLSLVVTRNFLVAASR